jgi:two-component system LytT family sensor kinase
VNSAALTTTVAVAGVLVALALAVLAVVQLRARQRIATPAQRATYEVLHTASLAAPPLRAGLTEAAAAKSVRHLHALLGSLAVGLVADGRVLAWEGPGGHHWQQVTAAAAEACETGRVGDLASADLTTAELTCGELDCQVRGGVVVPLTRGDLPVGALVALTGAEPAPGLVRAAIETGNWVSTQLSLAELDASRDRLAQAQVRALRAQISPHFIYNALSAISSLVRTDPERARELILEFAEFTRYSFRAHGEFTTLAEELRSIDRYLLIERARFGDRLQVRLQVAPEVLPVAVPFLCLQPLVENAVRHGLADKPGVGTISIVAQDAGAECLISVEDDGVGMEPSLLLRPSPNGPEPGQHVGLGNVDDRLRSVFGDDFGLVVETALGAGTKVIMRVPKFHPGVQAAGWAS